jgi:glycerophosphoryl diester phosphodiesterase
MMSFLKRNLRFLRAHLSMVALLCASAFVASTAVAQSAKNPYCPNLPSTNPIDTSTGGLTLSSPPTGISNIGIFGPNVWDILPNAAPDDIHHFLNLLNQESQFSTNRYAVFFFPSLNSTYSSPATATYGSCADPLVAQVGYYEQIVGLGSTPSATRIIGGLNADQILTDQNSGDGVLTQNFWRSQENMHVEAAGGPTNGVVDWGVSQGTSMRKMGIFGDLWYANSQFVGAQQPCAEASGGFTADSAISGVVNFCSQQQWFTRNSSLNNGFTSYVWNFVFSGVAGANLPAASFPGGSSGDANTTFVPKTPVSREKPYIYYDFTASDSSSVFVPAVQTNSVDVTWYPGPQPGTSIPMTDFYITNPSDTIENINNQLAAGMNLILTPGIYKFSQPIEVTNPNTVVLGLGFATLVPQQGNPAITVADVDGVSVSGLIIDAGPINSTVLFEVGEPGVINNPHSANPTALNDIFFRIGGGTKGSANVSLEVDSGNVILDNIWAWRADHGNPGTYGWTTNTASTGVVVNGSNVTALGLAVEHYQQDQTIWNGENGETIFYQSELPYDVPSQSAWQSDGSFVSAFNENENVGFGNGYPSYYVGPAVCNHTAIGLGIYSYFDQGVNIVDDNAIQVPPNGNISLRDLTTVFLNGSGQITNIVNGTGPTANSGDASLPQQMASFQGPGNCTPFSGPIGSTVVPSTVGISRPNPYGWSPSSIMTTIGTWHPDLTVVMSHRGSHASVNGSNRFVPENSLQAIGLAAQGGVEAVEVDVKLTSDGVPILSHDYNWGRETCNSAHFYLTSPFNPFIAAGNSSNDALNPAVSSVPLASMRSYWYSTYLRDNVSLACTVGLNDPPNANPGNYGIYPPTLADVLTYMTDNNLPIVLVLDIKDQTTAAAAWQVVVDHANDYAGNPYYNRVLFKIAARNFQGYTDIQNTFAYGPAGSRAALLFPYFGTADIQPTPKGFGSEAAINTWITNAEGNTADNIVAMEVNLKQPGGILSTTLDLAGGRYLVGAFSPYTEYNDPNNPGVAEFFSNKGYCAPCETLASYYYNGAPNGQDSDTADDRGSFSFLVGQGVKIITTDNAVAAPDGSDAVNYLTGIGQRNTSYYK